MFNGGKWLLAAIVFTAVSQVAAVNLRPQEASDIVDDMYKGCRSKAMEKFISSGLLQKELGHDEEFQKIWDASSQCSKLIPERKHEHSVAITAYTDDDNEDFQKRFDNAVDKLGVNISTYQDHFQFKSLHFLLMDSMMEVDPPACMSAYALTDEDIPPKTGSTVRFGSFTTAYLDMVELEKDFELHGRIILNITTCFFVNLETYSCSKPKKKLLLSPAELFTVANMKHIDDLDNDYTVVVLQHLKLNSEHNCYMFSGETEVTDPTPTEGGQKSRAPAVVSTQWLVSVLVVVMVFFNC